MSNSLVTQADEMLQQTNSNENNTNEIGSKGCTFGKSHKVDNTSSKAFHKKNQ